MFARNALPYVFRLVDRPETKALERYLHQEGYRPLENTKVMLCALEGFGFSGVSDVALMGLEDWFGYYLQLTQQAPSKADLHRRILQSIVLSTVGAVRFAEDQPVACGLGVLDQGYFGFFDVFTDPRCRGRGHARAIMQTLAAWAKNNGANRFYLQVVEQNAPARNLYKALGFADCYQYTYQIKQTAG